MENYLFVESMVKRMVGLTSSASNVHEVVNDNSNPYKNMVMNATRMNQGNISQCSIIIEEEHTADAAGFYDLLKDSDESLWNDYTNHSKLSIIYMIFFFILWLETFYYHFENEMKLKNMKF